MLSQASLYTNILAGDVLYIKLIGSTGLAQVRVTLSYSQVTRTLLGVALCLAAAPWKPLLAVRVTVAEFFAKVLCHDTGAVLVTSLSRVVAGSVVVHMIGGTVLLQLNLATVHGPESMLFLLLARWCAVVHMFFRWKICKFPLCKCIHLSAGLGTEQYGKCTVVAIKDSPKDTEQ